MSNGWRPLGVFSEGADVPLDCPDLWQQVDRWRRKGDVRLPHPHYAGQTHRLDIYEVDVNGRAISLRPGKSLQEPTPSSFPKASSPERSCFNACAPSRKHESALAGRGSEGEVSPYRDG
jgi:hypothetical protein